MFCMPVIFMIKITFVIFIANLSFSFILFLEHKSMCITLSLSALLEHLTYLLTTSRVITH